MQHRSIAALITVVSLLLLIGCYSRTPSIGTIEIDTERPSLYRGLLPIGITLDIGTQGKDLLDQNLLVNARFDLAPPLVNSTIDPEHQTVTTPNGFTTYYPYYPYHFGWEIRGGRADLGGQEGIHHSSLPYLTLRPTTDSIYVMRLLHVGNPFGVETGDELLFGADMKSTDTEQPIYISLVDEQGKSLTAVQAVQGTPEWHRHSVRLTVKSPSSAAFLLIEAGTSGTLCIDNCTLLPAEVDRTAPIPRQFYAYLDTLSADFIRFPGGRTTNGFYPGTYPELLPPQPTEGTDSPPPIRSMWTLPGAEYTGSFGIDQLLTLAADLGTHPILLTNVGITDPTAAPRSEEITRVPERAEQVRALLDRLKQYYRATTFQDSIDRPKQPTLQLGYDMDGQDYPRRFTAIASYLKEHLDYSVNLISAADLTKELTYTDFVRDIALTDITTPEQISTLFPSDYTLPTILDQPIMIGEAHFRDTAQAPFVPPLILRGAFLIEAERHTSNLGGISIAPLTELKHTSKGLPLLLQDGWRYTPTALYRLLRDFKEWRGSEVRALDLPDTEKSSGIRPLYLSLTSTREGRTYYLKAANTTRHPQTYTLHVKGGTTTAQPIEVIEYTPRATPTTVQIEDFDHFERRTRTLHLQSDRSCTLTLPAFSIVLIRLQQSPTAKAAE